MPELGTIEEQELFCHDCGNYVQFEIDLGLNGNHVLECPACGHEHCRVVRDGIITGQRWDQRNGTIPAYVRSYSSTSSTNDLKITYSFTSGGTAVYQTNSQNTS